MDKREASQYSISASVKASFPGGSVGIDTSYATQKYLAQQFESFMSHSRHTKQRKICKQTHKGHRAQIWQLKMHGVANDGKTVTIGTQHFVCTSSKNGWPKCLPDFCANDVCT